MGVSGWHSLLPMREAPVRAESLLLKNGGDPVKAFQEGQLLFNSSAIYISAMAAHHKNTSALTSVSAGPPCMMSCCRPPDLDRANFSSPTGTLSLTCHAACLHCSEPGIMQLSLCPAAGPRSRAQTSIVHLCSAFCDDQDVSANVTMHAKPATADPLPRSISLQVLAVHHPPAIN